MGAVARVTVATQTAAESPVAALRGRLEQLLRIVRTLPAAVYGARTSGVSGSIGEHVRHLLDHVAALVAAGPSSTLSYDHRARGTAVETEPGAAIREMMRLDAALERWGERRLEEPVAVTAVMSVDGQVLTGGSTLARELAFVMSHTIHHQAIVALLLEQQGAPNLDGRFGYAPSTLRR